MSGPPNGFIVPKASDLLVVYFETGSADDYLLLEEYLSDFFEPNKIHAIATGIYEIKPAFTDQEKRLTAHKIINDVLGVPIAKEDEMAKNSGVSLEVCLGLLGAVVVIVGFGVWVGGLQATVSSFDSKSLREERDAGIKKIEEKRDSVMHEFESVSKTIPIGSIVAWYGIADLIPEGFLLCDGASFENKEYPELFALLIKTDQGLKINDKKTSVPDLRGYFLRGADDPDVDGPLSAAGVDQYALERSKKRSIGSKQTDSTGSPANGLSTVDGSGNHTHTEQVRNNDADGSAAGSSKGARGTGTDPATITGGGHGHNLEGWDFETRPVNIAVNYLIRAR